MEEVRDVLDQLEEVGLVTAGDEGRQTRWDLEVDAVDISVRDAEGLVIDHDLSGREGGNSSTRRISRIERELGDPGGP